MNRRHFAFSLFTVIMIACLVWASPGAAQEKAKHTDNLLNALAQETGKNVADFEVLNEAVFSLPNIEGKYPTAKIRNKQTGERYEVTIDDKGKKADKEALLEQNLKIHKTKYGKLEPALYDKIQISSDNETIDVILWIAAPDDEPLKRPTADEFNAKGEYIIEMEKQAQTKEKKAKILKHQEPVVKHLKNMNAYIGDVNELAPVVATKLNKKQMEDIANRPDVEDIYLDVADQPTLDESVPLIGGRSVWARGNTGQGVPVAVVEPEGIVFDGVSLSGTNRTPNCFNTYNDHATNVAGVVGSLNSTYTGVSYNAQLVGAASYPVCSKLDSARENAINWAHEQGVQIYNHSYGCWEDRSACPKGTITHMGKYQDNAVFNWYTTMVAAAGNCTPDCYVLSPANAYNVIAVGSHYKSVNQMAKASSYINPTSAHSDREKPDVAAPGALIYTTYVTRDNNNYPHIVYDYAVSGTSVAAPHVTGGAALLAHRDNLLTVWPEAIKAILMATAVNDKDGIGPSTYLSRPDTKDGAGGVNLDAADLVASDRNKWKVAEITPSSFDSYKNMYYSFWADAGQTVRAVIAWDTIKSYAYYDNRPAVDLDIDQMYSPSGRSLVIPFGCSYDNSQETVEFTAPETGYYSMEINNHRFSIPSTWLGVAWYNYYK